MPTEGTLPAGCYSFPFTFLLPPELPGSFYESGHDFTASVKYAFKAEVHVRGMLKSNVKHSHEVTLLGAAPAEVLPATAATSSSVRWLCCINKGRVDMRGTFSKNCYVAGEEAMVRPHS
jgi:hypothetical protein